MVAEAIIEGEALVVRSITPGLALIAKPGIVGTPLYEAYTEPGMQPLLAMIDLVRVCGGKLSWTFTSPFGVSGTIQIRQLDSSHVLLRWRPSPCAVRSPLRSRFAASLAAATLAVQSAGLLPLGW